MFDDCIIMAGGAGSRLWPASSSRRPKQFLPAPPERSFFSAALGRALAVTRPGGRVVIIAGAGYRDAIAGACEEAERRELELILEPEARNTAPAIACGLVYAHLAGGGEDRAVLVLPSDHVIRPLPRFVADVETAAGAARQGRLVVFGVPPRSPETGYGYIEAETAPGGNVYQAASFREKPDRATAEKYLATGRFFWNSGMFAFSSRFMLEEFRRLAPGVIAPFEALGLPGAGAWETDGALRTLAAWPGLDRAYAAAERVSFDYAVAERCAATVMVKASFEWTDVGSWDEYARVLGGGGDLGEGPVFRTGAADSTFVDADIPVALCGASDLIVVIRSGKDGSPPGALIARRGETQEVRKLVEQMQGD